MSKFSYALLGVLLALSACGSDTDTGPDAYIETRSVFTQIQEDILSPNCASANCHGNIKPKKDLSLTSKEAYDHLVGVPSTEDPDIKRVDPGHPETSYLLIKLGVGDASLRKEFLMPSGEPRLPEEDLAKIEKWILDGAPE